MLTTKNSYIIRYFEEVNLNMGRLRWTSKYPESGFEIGSKEEICVESRVSNHEDKTKREISC